MFDEAVPEPTCPRDGSDRRRTSTPREAEGGVIAYLADHSATDGAARLFGQKARIEAAASSLGLRLSGYEVDSGRGDAPAPYGYALLRLLSRARRGGVATLLVEHVSCMAPDYGDALLAAVTFLEHGVELIEARGGRVRREQQIEALVRRSIPRSARGLRNAGITVLREC